MVAKLYAVAKISQIDKFRKLINLRYLGYFIAILSYFKFNLGHLVHTHAALPSTEFDHIISICTSI